jgi:hypothetical protein
MVRPPMRQTPGGPADWPGRVTPGGSGPWARGFARQEGRVGGDAGG